MISSNKLRTALRSFKANPTPFPMPKNLTLEDEDLYDEVDQFHKDNDFVGLNDDRESESDVEIPEDVSYDDSDEGEEEEGLAGFEEFEEDIDGEIQDERNITNQWGNRKDVYYSTDAPEGDRDLEEEELEEVQRLRRQQLELVDEEDLVDDDILENIASKAEHRSAIEENPTLDAKILSDFNKTFDDITFDLDTSISQEKIERDLSHLTQEEKIEMIRSQSPEVIHFANEYVASVKGLKDIVDMIGQIEREMDLCDSEREMEFLKMLADFFQFKAHLLRSYCLNLKFFFFTRSKNTVLSKDHRVFHQMLLLKNTIDEYDVKEQQLFVQWESMQDDFLSDGEEDNFSEPVDTEDGDVKSEVEGDEEDIEALLQMDEAVPLKSSTRKNAPFNPSIYADEADFVTSRDDNTSEVPLDILKRKKPSADTLKTLEELFDDDFDSEEEETPKKHKEKTRPSREERRSVTFAETTQEPIYGADPDTIDGRRKITRQIMKNKGIQRYRKKSDKNPRKKFRNKYRKAEIKRKSVVREYNGKQSIYGGESSGIKDNLSRSTLLGK